MSKSGAPCSPASLSSHLNQTMTQIPANGVSSATYSLLTEKGHLRRVINKRQLNIWFTSLPIIFSMEAFTESRQITCSWPLSGLKHKAQQTFNSYSPQPHMHNIAYTYSTSLRTNGPRAEHNNSSTTTFHGLKTIAISYKSLKFVAQKQQWKCKWISILASKYAGASHCQYIVQTKAIVGRCGQCKQSHHHARTMTFSYYIGYARSKVSAITQWLQWQLLWWQCGDIALYLRQCQWCNIGTCGGWILIQSNLIKI